MNGILSVCVCVGTIQQVCVQEGELIPVDSLEIFRPLTVCDGLPLEGCVLSIRYVLKLYPKLC